MVKKYLTAVFEECGKPGGTQLFLLPMAIIAVAVYVLGYPCFIAYILWKNRELIMEDQLLRALCIGDDKLTNPNAYHIRKRWSRMYYMFKPDMTPWALAILLRKFCIAATYILFNRNASFQLAAALLVMILAFSAQARAAPYMSTGDFEEVLRLHELAALTSPTHAKLKSNIEAVKARGKKVAKRSGGFVDSRGKISATALLAGISYSLFSYNTMELIMLFSAVIVALMGVMFGAQSTKASYYASSRDSIAAVVITVVIASIIYLIVVIAAEFGTMAKAKHELSKMKKSENSRSNKKLIAGRRSIGDDSEEGSTPKKSKEKEKSKLKNSIKKFDAGDLLHGINPMMVAKPEFQQQNNDDDEAANIVASMREPPIAINIWANVREKYLQLAARATSIKTELENLPPEVIALMKDEENNKRNLNTSSKKPAVASTTTVIGGGTATPLNDASGTPAPEGTIAIVNPMLQNRTVKPKSADTSETVDAKANEVSSTPVTNEQPKVEEPKETVTSSDTPVPLASTPDNAPIETSVQAPETTEDDESIDTVTNPLHVKKSKVMSTPTTVLSIVLSIILCFVSLSIPVVEAQSVLPSNVQVSSFDRALEVSWIMNQADENITGFSIIAIPSKSADNPEISAPFSYEFLESFSSPSSGSWTNRFTSAIGLSNTGPLNTITPNVAGGFATLTIPSYSSQQYLSVPTTAGGIITAACASTNQNCRFRSPMMAFDEGITGIFTFDRVFHVRSNPVPNTVTTLPAVDAGVMAYWKDPNAGATSGDVYPVAGIFHSYFYGNYTANRVYIFYRAYSGTSPYLYGNWVNLPSGDFPVDLYIIRNHNKASISFAYAVDDGPITPINLGTTPVSSFIFDGYFTMVPPTTLFNPRDLRVALFSGVRTTTAGSSRTARFDLFGYMTLATWEANFFPLRERTLRVTMPTCYQEHNVTRYNIYYSQVVTNYRARVSGLMNGLKYRLQINVEGLAPIWMLTNEYVPVPKFPQIVNKGATADTPVPILFLDAFSLPPNTANIYRWRDSSGNNRDFVQFEAAGATTSAASTTFPLDPVYGVRFATNSEFISENITDKGLDLSNNKDGMSWFYAHIPVTGNLPNNGQQVIMSRNSYVYSASGTGRIQTMDSPGWDIFSHSNAGFNTRYTGARVVTTRNAGSSKTTPNINQIGIQYNFQTTTHIDAVTATAGAPIGPTVYSYSLSPFANNVIMGTGQGGGFLVTDGTLFRGGYLYLDGCRGIPAGKNTDLCWAPNLYSSPPVGQQAVASGTRWTRAYTYQTGTYPAFTSVTTNYYNQAEVPTISDAQRTTLSDAVNYYYYTTNPTNINPQPNRMYTGTLNGVLIYSPGITMPEERNKVSKWISARYGGGCLVQPYGNVTYSVRNGYNGARCYNYGYLNPNEACNAVCAAPTVRIGGFNTLATTPPDWLMCYRGVFSAPPPLCGLECPALPADSNIATCKRSLVNINFQEFPGITEPLFTPLPLFDIQPPDTLQRMHDTWRIDPVEGKLYGSLPYGVDTCNPFNPSVFTLNRPRWAEYPEQTGYPRLIDPTTYSIDITLKDKDMRAGLAFRILRNGFSTTTANNFPLMDYYRFVISVGTGTIALEAVQTTDGTQPIATVTMDMAPLLDEGLNYDIVPNQVYRLRAVCFGSANIKLYINDTLVSDVDTPDPALVQGSIGVYLESGEVIADNMYVVSSCEADGACRPADEGHSCDYTCKPGFRPIAPRITCQAGFPVTDTVCIPEEPQIADKAPVFWLPEDAPVGTTVGQIMAIPSSPSLTLQFSIIGGNNNTIIDDTGAVIQTWSDIFSVAICDGKISYVQGGALDYSYGAKNLTVLVRIGILKYSIHVDIPVTINVLNRRSAPFFGKVGNITESVNRQISEAAKVGTAVDCTPQPCTTAITAVLGEVDQILNYVLEDDAAGLFTVNATSAVISLAQPNILDYEGVNKTSQVPNQYQLLLRAFDVTDPKLSATIFVFVDILNAWEPPNTYPLVFDVSEVNVNANLTYPGILPIFDDEDYGDVIKYTIYPSSCNQYVYDMDMGNLSAVPGGCGSMLYLNETINAPNVTLALKGLDLGPIYTRTFFPIDNRVVRTYFTIDGKVTDPHNKTAPFSISTYLIADPALMLRPILSGYSIQNGDVNALRTGGGQQLIITGERLDAIYNETGALGVRVLLSNKADSSLYFPIDNCALVWDSATNMPSKDTIICGSTPAGYGRNLQVTVKYGNVGIEVRIMPTIPMYVSYAPPVILSASLEVNNTKFPPLIASLYTGTKDITHMDTQGGQPIRLMILNCGPKNISNITLTYGPTGKEYIATKVTIFEPSGQAGEPGVVLAYTTAGVGKNHIFVYTIRQESLPAPTVQLSYAAPEMYNITVSPGQSNDWTLNTLVTRSSTPIYIDISGSQFGPMNIMPVGRYFNNSAAIYSNGLYMNTIYSYALTCTKPNPILAHSLIRCALSPGVGISLRVEISVDGQFSALSRQTLSYAIPKPTSIAGVGAKLADTAGGQNLVIIGSSFGPLRIGDGSLGAISSPPITVKYGHRGTEYTAKDCRISSTSDDTRIECITAPGTGKNLSVTVYVGSTVPQYVPVYDTCTTCTIDYAQPVVTSLTHSLTDLTNADYRTTGNETVVISGKNFGPCPYSNEVAPCRLNSMYLIYFEMPLIRTINPLGQKIGESFNRFNASNCTMTVEHEIITCYTVPAAGTGLAWTLLIDGQRSTQPTIGYHRPVLSSVDDGNSNPVLTASTTGGDVIVIHGYHFGPTELGNNICGSNNHTQSFRTQINYNNQGCHGYVQAVRYGPTGNEYLASDILVANSNTMYVRLVPGFGKNLLVTVYVGDQVSIPLDLNNPPVFSYASPSITAIVNTTGPSDPHGQQRVTISGINFALLDIRATVGIRIGNPSDNTLRTSFLSISDPYPRYGDIQSIASWTATANGIESVTFVLPEGILPSRGIQLIVYPKGFPTSSLAVSSNVLTDNSYFSYDTPVIESMVLTRPILASDPDLRAKLLLALDDNHIPNAYTSADVDERIVRLIVTGYNFGPAQSVLSDKVSRIIRITGLPGDSVDPAYPYIDTWTHNRIECYMSFNSIIFGTSYIDLMGLDYSGNNNVSVTSNSYAFADLAPSISNIMGASDPFPTEGGGYVTLHLQNLASTSTGLQIFVGSHEAMVVDPDTHTDLPTFADITNAILNHPLALAGNATTWKIAFRVPPGEGIDNPITIVRNNRDRSEGGGTINYLPPTITSYQIWTPTPLSSGTVGLDPLINGTWGQPITLFLGSIMEIPTESTKIRLVGINFGLCPVVSIGSAVPKILNGAGGTSCKGTIIPPRNSANTPSDSIANFHTELIFLTAPGEGNGEVEVPGLGYQFILSVGGQTQTSGTIKLRYTPPKINIVAPSTLRTVGGELLNITGTNFGTKASTIQIYIGTSVCNDVTLSRAVTSSDSSLVTCRVPAGIGANLPISFSTVAYLCTLDTVCSYTITNSFSYKRPVIYQMYSPQALLDNETLLANTLVTNAGFVPGMIVPKKALGPALYDSSISVSQPIYVPSLGNVEIILQGDNFGPAMDLSKDTCMFFAWRGRSIAIWSAGQALVCNDLADFPGEGEVPNIAVTLWNDTMISFLLPPGIGGRDIYPVVGGQSMVNPPIVYYTNPVLYSMSPNHGSTDGTTSVDFIGKGFGPAMFDTSDENVRDFVLSARTLPNTLIEWLYGTSEPLAMLRIDFGRKCIAQHTDPKGNVPVAVATCLHNIDLVDKGALTIHAPMGINVNISVNVSIIDIEPDGSVRKVTTESLLYSYDPPLITDVSPRPVRMDGTSGSPVLLLGYNFGTLIPGEDWTDDELEIIINIESYPCDQAERQTRGGYTMLTCATPDLPAGYHNISYKAAGQWNFNSRNSSGALFAGCSPGFYGKEDEKCLRCPIGANCYGFDTRIRVPGTQSEIDGGTHSYPRPRALFYNLNSSDFKTTGMLDACPPAVFNGRDVCIVACEPPEACIGDNYCAQGYKSESPMFRCAVCELGFYKRGNECIKCPDSPWALVIGFVMLVLFGGAGSYVLNKKKINIAFIAIFIDWAQVLAIFANSKVAWPPLVKEIFHILSAFNLNIEIVAPECVIPNLAYRNKWLFIMGLPICIGLLFGLLTAGTISYEGLIKRRKVNYANHGSALVSSVFLLMYVLYIYVTRNVLDMFNCQPTEPPDGRTYLTAVFEECGKPGGTQRFLIPYAVVAIIIYVAGYPFVTFWLVRSNLELIMEDQLLRAKGVGDDRLTNPRAYPTRKRYGRIYYQFKPDKVYWVLAILFRKFCIAATYILFNRNATFQLAAALLVIFVSYAAQVMNSPYMGPADYEDVLRSHMRSAVMGNRMHLRLHALLENVEARGRIRSHKNILNAKGQIDAKLLIGVLRGWLFRYNTVEEILLFSAMIVSLMGIMYASQAKSASYYSDAKDSVTTVIVGTIILTLVYFFSVVAAEVATLYGTESRRKRLLQLQKQIEKNEKNGVNKTTKQSSGRSLTGGKSTAEEMAETMRASKAARRANWTLGAVDQAINPLFTTANGGSSAEILEQTIADMPEDTLPDYALWGVFRGEFARIQTEVQQLAVKSAQARMILQKRQTDSEEQKEERNRIRNRAGATNASTTTTGSASTGLSTTASGNAARRTFAPKGFGMDDNETVNPLNKRRKNKAQIGAIQAATGTGSMVSMSAQRKALLEEAAAVEK